METAREAALGLRQGYRFGGDSPSLAELLQVAADAGVAVDVDWPLPGRVRSIYGYRRVGLQRGLAAPWQRWCLAHELGHHFLHPAGNHFYLAARDRRLLNRQEAEAEVFAGACLFGPLDRPVEGVLDVMSLAAWADVPLACASRWVHLTGLEAPPVVSLDRQDVDYAALQAEPVRGEHRVRPWSPFLAAVFAGMTLLHADLDQDGVVRALHWVASGLPLLG